MLRLLTVVLVLVGCVAQPPQEPRKIGVLYLVHGGTESYNDASTWNNTLQIFAYDPNTPVYQRVIWNPNAWPRILAAGNAPKERRKYAFEYERIGGTDSFDAITARQLAQLRTELVAAQESLNVEFVVDWGHWISSKPEQLVYPRLIYYPPNERGKPVTYCGEPVWPNCDPQRYDTDGGIDRMLAAGVDDIVLVDTTTSGVRFFKTFDMVELIVERVAEYNVTRGTQIGVHWVNDPTGLMMASYPEDEGWTGSAGAPKKDRRVPLTGRPNPVTDDPAWAEPWVDGIVDRFSPDVPAAQTGVVLVNHATRLMDRYYDPKVDDTLTFNRNIQRALLDRYPEMAEEQILTAWMGMKVPNANLGGDLTDPRTRERSREMRGENLGDAFLYESDALPDGDEGLRYWDVLQRLIDRKVKHIVIAFPQITTDSVLNIVELPNQIAKEIGYKTWLRHGQPDYELYPKVGHPFADYWGMWVETSCRAIDGDAEEACCLTMGGCPGPQPYPPQRQAPVDKLLDDLDPSLAYDVSAYGHLGYDPNVGPPSDDAPVQNQYRGTWEIWQPPNDDPRIGKLLASKVVALVEQLGRQDRLVAP